MIAIVDYGMGNLRSVQKAIEHLGGAAAITARGTALQQAQGIVLPGVGAFGDAVRNLRARGLYEPLRQAIAAGRPTLGICLGMQLLFEESEEMGLHRGLGVLPGRVVRLFGGTAAGGKAGRGKVELPVPHVGWNTLSLRRSTPLLAGLRDGDYAYFVHSYYAAPTDPDTIWAATDYGIALPAVVGRDNVFGVQFHPEKSQRVGLALLGNFLEIARRYNRTDGSAARGTP